MKEQTDDDNKKAYCEKALAAQKNLQAAKQAVTVKQIGQEEKKQEKQQKQ